MPVTKFVDAGSPVDGCEVLFGLGVGDMLLEFDRLPGTCRVDMLRIEQNAKNNAEYTHFSAVNDFLQCLYIGILHKPRALPLRVLDAPTSIKDSEDLFGLEENSVVTYEPI